MRLYERLSEPCARLAPVRTPDGQGGFSSEWRETGRAGVSFAPKGSDPRDGAAPADRARYSCTSDAPVAFGEVLRRESDGAAFRVVSACHASPRVASFRLWRFEAEEWEVPDA